MPKPGLMADTAPDPTQAWRTPRTTIGQMPRRSVAISPKTRILDLESVFMADPLLSSVVVADREPVCITRAWFFNQLVGPLGFGRELYARHPVTQLPRAQTLTLDADTTIADAAQAVLERAEAHRYDDIVVRFDGDAYSSFRVAELFAELAHTQAYESLHDALTGLPNRRLFYDRLSAVHARAVRERDAPFAVLFIDIDDFKTINDGLGHDVGDRALMETADRLCQLLEPGITIARLGGDEFGMLIEASSTEVEPHEVAERIAELMSRPMELGSDKVALTASVGVAIGPDGASPDELMRNADLAMYAVKHHQKGRYAFYEGAMHTRARERLELRGQLEGALERDEFRLHYQPIVELESQSILGAEVLLRWERPKDGLIPPVRFIPACEKTGLIVPVGRWVLKQACERAVAWGAAHPGHRSLRLSVNLSPRQLQEPGFVSDVEAILAETGMPAPALVLEITESVLIENLHDAVERLNELKALGIHLALDDFGTGFSSLGYLSRLPIDLVKLDRAFVSQLVGGADRGLLRGVVALAQSLDLTVVAEGVEEEEQVHELQAAGCHQAQGYYFARPMNGSAYTELLGDGITPPTLPVPVTVPWVQRERRGTPTLR